MNVEAQVAKLESLLARITENRHPMPTRSAAPASAAPASHAQATQPVAASSPAPFEPAEPDARRPRSVPTPMEQALSFELGAREEEVEILVEHEDDEEPELSIDLEPVSQERPTSAGADAPTAPVGTRAPLSLDAPTAPIGTPAAPAARALEDAAQPVSAPGPSPIPIARTEAGAAVARVVAPARARTFGELLERTLALRPR